MRGVYLMADGKAASVDISPLTGRRRIALVPYERFLECCCPPPAPCACPCESYPPPSWPCNGLDQTYRIPPFHFTRDATDYRLTAELTATAVSLCRWHTELSWENTQLFEFWDGANWNPMNPLAGNVWIRIGLFSCAWEATVFQASGAMAGGVKLTGLDPKGPYLSASVTGLQVLPSL